LVQAITNDPSAATIVSAVISMGRSLNQRVVAEGVETGEQLAALHVQHCGEAQGHYFSPAVPPEQFADLLAADTAFNRGPAHRSLEEPAT
jgi:EAL domain-containing protein (putative c-di-GMP-specific phosphodiesterase class I)